MKILYISVFLTVFMSLYYFNCKEKNQDSTLSKTISSNIPKENIVSSTNNQKANRVDVYYFHRTKRCHGCLNLEKMMHEALKQFEQKINTGDVTLKVIDIEKEEEYVSRYNLTMPGITFVSIKNNDPLKYKNLEEAWQLTDDLTKFNDYIKVELESALKEVL